ncbi:MAG TPA: helix-hairpin-helix domain-containing protein [Verrucomicrobiae bacterium]|jgi:competence ComEA-like helix-hairpin-helix protein|nr:helix-hairpin-helix domain-containing protein [Verrucomicrobiae bacterium]
MRRRGSILIGLLWCVALLSLVVIGVLHTARIDLLVGKNYGDRIQAHYLALAGVEKAEALLYQNARDRSRSDKNHSGELYNEPQQFRDVSLGRGVFRVFRRGREDEGGGVIYGVSDEESRLNVNSADTNELMKLDGMTSDIAAAIVDWRNSGNNPAPGGAGQDYYTSLQPPYLPRNAPFETVRELLMVRGVSADLLLGKDAHQNGFFDPGEDLASADSRSGDAAADVDSGWAGILTADSQIKNVNAAGQDRVNVQNASETELTSIPGITPVIARAIVAYRGRNQFQSIADLLDVTAAQNQNDAQAAALAAQGFSDQSQSGGGQSPGGASGPQVIDEDLFQDIADDVTLDTGETRSGIININTAGVDVLCCIPGIDRPLAQAIVSYRQSSGYFPSIGGLLKVPGMNRQLFKQAAPFVDARSETYRILSEGRVNSTGTRQRLQVIVHIGLHDVSTVSYREDSL